MPTEPLVPTPEEQKLIDAAASGTIADYSSEDPEMNNPEKGEEWGAERTIRAEVVYALATGTNPAWRVHAKGVRLKGAKIAGQLDFDSAAITSPLVLNHCYIEGTVVLKDASAKSLDLRGSYISGGIFGPGLRVDHDVWLGEGFTAKDSVALIDATIGGSLICSGGKFESPGSKALNMDRAKVRGSIFLGQGFSAKGEVRLNGAVVGGQLDCADGHIENPNSQALDMDCIDVKGDVLLGSDFTAKGEVRLIGAIVRGQLTCTDGLFENANGMAIGMDHVDVKGSIFLRSGFKAKGEVRLIGASIGSQLNCSGGHFENANGKALGMDHIDVKGSVFLGSGFTAKGEVRLNGAKVGGTLNCKSGAFENPTDIAINIENALIKGSLFMKQGFHAEGTVDLGHASLGVLVDDPDAWPGLGKLLLEGFRYGAVHGPCDASSRLDWLGRQKEFHPQPYEQLARVLRQMGHEHEARRILYAKHLKLRSEGGLGYLSRFWNWILQRTVGYGFNPWRAFWWMLAIFLLGFAVSYAGWGSGLMVRTQPRTNGVPYPAFHATLYSLEQFSLPPLTLGEKNYWRPNARSPHDPFFWFFEIYFIFQGLAGWVLTGLVIAAVTGVIKKE